MQPIKIKNPKIVTWNIVNQRIQQVLHDRGLSVTRDQAQLLWEYISAVEFSASWMSTDGMSDTEVYDLLEPHIEPDENAPWTEHDLTRSFLKRLVSPDNGEDL